jgi:benzylsuccinate CoA-transferase BbsF subunit
MQSAKIPCFPVQSTTEVLDSPHYKAREFFVNQKHPIAGVVKQPGPPMRFGETPWALRSPAPTLGQHNNLILNGARPSQSPSNAPPFPVASGENNRPLDGIRIVDFGWILSVPHCGAWLGSLGAQVIRVESNARLEINRGGAFSSGNGGPNKSASWNGLNYSKLGATLNLRHPEAVKLVEELVATSDVVMENFATGVLERLGLGYSHLRTIKPDLVMISGSTMGVTGPDRNSMGFGPNVCSYAGQPFITGYEGGPPQNLGGNWPDYLVGTIMAFSIMSALWHRNRTGQGQYIEVSMAETITSMMPEAFLEYTMTGKPVERIGNHDPDMVPHNVYECEGDDAWVAIAVRSDEEWRSLCQILGRPELSDHPKFATLKARKSNEPELDTLVGEWCASRANSEITNLLQAQKIPAGPIMNVFDLVTDPHMVSRGYTVEIDHPAAGAGAVGGLPVKFSAMPKLPYFHAPLLGQHNEYVFADLLGHRLEQVEELKNSKAIY